MRRTIAAVTLLVTALPAVAGWYEVKNYEGAIGPYPVHVSIQTFNWLNGHDKNERGKVVGSYYYDSKRIPIRLHGKQLPDGTLRLCETQDLKAIAGGLNLTYEQKHADPCPFLLTPTPDGATGKWQNEKASYDVTLKAVGKMDNTEKDVLTGKMEVPMWDRSSKYMYLGIYEMHRERLIMRWIRAVNIATGKVERVADLACTPSDDYCMPGLLYTDIYLNVSKTDRAAKVSVGYGGGKMGADEEVTLPRSWK